MLNRIPQTEIKNTDEFLTPITQDNPCGPYIKRDPILTRLKELRAIVTDNTASGPWKPKEKLGDTVGESIQLSEEFLKKISKDLTVAVYYTEALTKKYGFFGLDQGLSVIYALCETYWDKVNPDLSAENAPMRITAFKLLQKILIDQLNFAPIVVTASNEQLNALDILKKEKGHEPTKVKNKIIAALAKEESGDLNFFKEKLQNSIKILNALSVRSEELDLLLETQEAPNFSKQAEILKLVLELVNSALNPQALQLATESAIANNNAQTTEEDGIKDFTVNDNSIKSIKTLIR